MNPEHSDELHFKAKRNPAKMFSRILISTVSNKYIFIPSIILMLIGVVISAPITWSAIIYYLTSVGAERIGLYLVMIPPLVIFTIVYYRVILSVMNRRYSRAPESDDFLSVDFRSANRRSKDGSLDTEELLSAIQRASRQESFDYGKIRDIIENTIASNKKVRAHDHSTFIGYFHAIVETLETKADAADQKASILLNKGTAYSQGGIAFFILSIIVWQALSWANQFQVQFIYGIVSCSLLFVFIEFLSAWFLRQYRHFVDTSTYLLRVKAILDRYFLTYLAAKEQGKDDGSIDSKAFVTLNSMLKEPIRWPETELFDKANTSFAKDAADSLTSLAKEVKRKKSVL